MHNELITNGIDEIHLQSCIANTTRHLNNKLAVLIVLGVSLVVVAVVRVLVVVIGRTIGLK